MSIIPNRDELLRQAGEAGEWDYIVVGGGATGLGTALEAASRGYRTLLLEAQDFAKATSSRSTKLVHGGVRYLQQGNVKLVLEALRERGRMLRNAPHLAHRQAFIVPAYSVLDLPFYGVGLTVYDMLAGKEGLGRSRILSRRSAMEALPGVEATGLRGGILYYDGQFDDARFAIALLRTFLDLGGVAVNYLRVKSLLKSNGIVNGVMAEDGEGGGQIEARAKVVINATGIFSDGLRHMDEPQSKAMLTVSQGTHFVLPRRFLPGSAALMIPKTSDGRVLFAIPWHDRVVVGTTDEPVPAPQYEPRALEEEQELSRGEYPAISWQQTETRGCAQHVVRAKAARAAAGQIEHGCHFSRPHGSDFAFQAGDDYGGEVDDLSQDGTGCDRPDNRDSRDWLPANP